MGKGGRKGDFFFCFQSWVRKEGVEREAITSLYDLRRSGDRLPIGQGLKSEYSTRAKRGY